MDSKLRTRKSFEPQLLLHISGSWLVAPSSILCNTMFSNLHVCNLSAARIINSFKLGRSSQPIHLLATQNFDPKTSMGALQQH